MVSSLPKQTENWRPGQHGAQQSLRTGIRDESEVGCAALDGRAPTLGQAGRRECGIWPLQGGNDRPRWKSENREYEARNSLPPYSPPPYTLPL